MPDMVMTITLGNVMTIASVCGAAAVLYGRLVAIETKLAPIWQEWCDRQPSARNRRTGDTA